MDGFVSLSAEECLGVLGRQRVAHVAISHHALPAIVTVDYAMDGQVPVFRTRHDSMLAKACLDTVVAFAVNDDPARTADGATVLIVGVASAVTDLARLRALGFPARGGGNVRYAFRTVRSGTMTGRREFSSESPRETDDVLRH
jgi:hypothetical protein